MLQSSLRGQGYGVNTLLHRKLYDGDQNCWLMADFAMSPIHGKYHLFTV